MTSHTQTEAAPYSLNSSTPRELLLNGRPVFRLAWPGVTSVSMYEANLVAELAVALLNKSYREGISTADLRSFQAIDEAVNGKRSVSKAEDIDEVAEQVRSERSERASSSHPKGTV